MDNVGKRGEETVPTWDMMWELQQPAGTAEELLSGLLIREMLDGSSFDVEVDGPGYTLAVDFTVGDELEDGSYRLVVTADVEGPKDANALLQFLEEIVAEMVSEAEELVAHRQELGSVAQAELSFLPVPEELERWDLVIPDWLAPDDCEVPHGFRPFLTASAEPWPDDGTIDEHGRVVLVPDGDLARLFGVPAPPSDEGEDEEE